MAIRDLVIDAARRHGVPPDLALRVANTESAFDQGAVSPKGAVGVMQLMEGTASDLGVNRHDLRQNIDGGVRYLKQQLDTFGTPELALAAYNAGPNAVRKYGGVPPYAETRGYVRKINGGADVEGFDGSDIFGMGGGGGRSGPGQEFDGSDIFKAPEPAPPRPGQPGAKPPPQISGNATPAGRAYASPADIAALATTKPKSQVLGLVESIAHVGRRVAPYTPANLFPGFREANAASLDRLDAENAERRKTAAPGGIGRFTGDLILSGGLAGPLSPLVGGAVSGAVLSDAEDAEGTLKDAATSAIFSRLTAAGSDALQLGARRLLSKAPSVLKPAELGPAKEAAYKAVDASGFRFGRKQVAALADDFGKSVAGSALSKSAKDDAGEIITYTRSLSKGDLSLSDLEKLRGDIYQAMVVKGGDTGRLGAAFRAKIDDMIDAVGDTTVREARALNARVKKADVVTRASLSADRAAERAYGGDYGRKLKDRLNPLVDELMPNRNLRGATPDEKAALERLVRGTKVQNAASTVAGMLDPRRLGGKIMAGITGAGGGAGAPFTGGLSLLVPTTQMGTGLALTQVASNAAKRNLDDLVKLIAAGGSRQAVARVPTKASERTEKVIARVLRPALVTTSVPAAAAAKPKRSQGR